jgi:hypothetical protein
MVVDGQSILSFWYFVSFEQRTITLANHTVSYKPHMLQISFRLVVVFWRPAPSRCLTLLLRVSEIVVSVWQAY